MDPELLPGSESGTQKIQSWIRIRNNSFRIHNTAYMCRKTKGSVTGEEVKLLQKKMKQLFLQQKNKGGIIDLEVGG